MAKVVALGPMQTGGVIRKAGEEFDMSDADAKSHEACGLVFLGTKSAFDKKNAASEKEAAELDEKTKAEAIANAVKQEEATKPAE